MCDWDGRLDNVTVGLDAAHVRWWAAGGADTIQNGMCLCSLHHKLFDLGVLGITPDYRVTVSPFFVGRGDAVGRSVIDLSGTPVLRPPENSHTVALENVEWHLNEVFRS